MKIKKKQEKLTERQKMFVDEFLVNGFNGRQAYNSIYGKKENEVADACASRLLSKAKVKKYFNQKRKKLRKKIELQKEDNLLVLQGIIVSGTVGQKLSAVEMVNKMLGYEEPARTENINKIINEVADDKETKAIDEFAKEFEESKNTTG